MILLPFFLIVPILAGYGLGSLAIRLRPDRPVGAWLASSLALPAIGFGLAVLNAAITYEGKCHGWMDSPDQPCSIGLFLADRLFWAAMLGLIPSLGVIVGASAACVVTLARRKAAPCPASATADPATAPDAAFGDAPDRATSACDEN